MNDKPTRETVAAVGLARLQVPTHLQQGLMRYVYQHVATGSFLRAVLENDLAQAAMRGDPVGRYHMANIVDWLFEYAPSDCWGSPAAVTHWLGDAPDLARLRDLVEQTRAEQP